MKIYGESVFQFEVKVLPVLPLISMFNDDSCYAFHNSIDPFVTK